MLLLLHHFVCNLKRCEIGREKEIGRFATLVSVGDHVLQAQRSGGAGGSGGSGGAALHLVEVRLMQEK